MNPLALMLAVLLAFVGWFSTDSGEAGFWLWQHVRLEVTL